MALEAILAAKRTEVAARRAARPLATLRDGIEPTDRDFEVALRRRRPAFILEVKPASPSEGAIRDPSDLDAVVASYGRHADAVSVLTDERFFGGSFPLLSRVRAAVSQPVLCKDFVLEPYQVIEARRAGADAILLMLSVLDDDGWRACAAEANALGMGILTEVHDPREIARAMALGARVIGLNSRDLRTLTVDLEALPRLAAMIPAGPLVIAESGIRSRADVRRLGNGVDGFLVGTTLMRAPDPDRAVRHLVVGPTKICGLTRAEDAALAARFGATHGGVILAAESPRRIEPAAAEAIVGAGALEWVGVFVDAELARIARLVDRLGLAAVQLHGREGPAEVAGLRALLPPTTEIWQAIRVGTRRPAIPASGADRLLFDTADGSRRGGAGIPFDWTLVAGLVPDGAILAGGIGPATIERALRTGFDFFDANSALERAPGVKSSDAMARFCAARRAFTLPTRQPS